MILDNYVKGYMPETKTRTPKLTMDYLVPTFDGISDSEKYVGAYPKPPYVVIDVDNHNNDPRNVNAFKRVLYNYKGNYIWWNTSTGVCALFKLPKQLQKQANGDVLLACGIPVEYKSSFNKGGDIGNNKFTIVKDGKIREPHQVGHGVDELPKEFYAIKFNFTNSKGNTLANGKDDGGYNIETYLNNFQMPCMSVGMTNDDVSHVIDIINNFVLTKKRDDIDKHKNAIEQQRNKVKLTEHDEIGDLLIRENNYYYLDDYGVCSYNNGNITKPLEKLDLERVVRAYNKKLKNKDVSEVINYIISMSNYVKDIKRFNNLLPVENGVVDLYSGELKEYDDTLIINKLPVTYDPTVTTCEEFDDWIEDITSKNTNNIERDNEAIDMIYECIANGFSMNNRLNKMYILYGDTRNGKSTLSKFLAYFFGERNILNADLSVLNGSDCEKYKAMLQHKRMWLGDDLDGARLDKTSDLKKIITGETVTGRPIYGTPTTVTPYCGLLMGCNGIPYIGNGNDVDAIMERVMFMHFRRYYGDNPNTNIDDILHTERCKTYVLNKAIEAWQRIRKAGYTEYDTSLDLKNKYRNELNPYQKFVRTNDLSGLANKDVWGLWRKFVKDNELDEDYLLHKTRICKSIRSCGGYTNDTHARKWRKIK